MAHVAKYNVKALGNLVAHYERSRQSTLDRGNIDKARTALNYDLRPSDMVERVRAALEEHEQTAGRKARSDAVVMVDWVVTLPGNVDVSMEQKFFESVVGFVEERYGAGNVLGAHVHMDETTPHVHISVLPTIDGKLQASKMVNRTDLKTFHGDLRKYVEKDLGCSVEIMLDDSKVVDKALSKVSQKELDKARAAIVADAEKERDAVKAEIERERERLECLRREREEREVEVERVEVEAERLERVCRAVDACEHARLGGKRKAFDEVVAVVKQAIAEIAAELRVSISRSMAGAAEMRGLVGRVFEVVRPVESASRARPLPVVPTPDADRSYVASIGDVRKADIYKRGRGR